jgi:hypothetical protein
MAKMHKLTKGGQTIFPATIYDAVVNPQTRKSLTAEIAELESSLNGGDTGYIKLNIQSWVTGQWTGEGSSLTHNDNSSYKRNTEVSTLIKRGAVLTMYEASGKQVKMNGYGITFKFRDSAKNKVEWRWYESGNGIQIGNTDAVEIYMTVASSGIESLNGFVIKGAYVKGAGDKISELTENVESLERSTADNIEHISNLDESVNGGNIGRIYINENDLVTGRWTGEGKNLKADSMEGYLRTKEIYDINLKAGDLVSVYDKTGKQVKANSLGLNMKFKNSTNTSSIISYQDSGTYYKLNEDATQMAFFGTSSAVEKITGYFFKGFRVKGFDEKISELTENVESLERSTADNIEHISNLDESVNGGNIGRIYINENDLVTGRWTGEGKNLKADSMEGYLRTKEIYDINLKAGDLVSVYDKTGKQVKANSLGLNMKFKNSTNTSSIISYQDSGTYYKLNEDATQMAFFGTSSAVEKITGYFFKGFRVKGFDEKISDVDESIHKHINDVKITDFYHSLKILFIGSSFGVDTINYVGDIAHSYNFNIVIGNLYVGASGIKDYITFYESDRKISYYKWNLNAIAWENGTSTVKEALSDEAWDFVVIQNGAYQSADESTYWDQDEKGNITKNYVNLFADIIDRCCLFSHPVICFNMTWAYSVYHTLSSSQGSKDKWLSFGINQKQRQLGMYTELCRLAQKVLQHCPEVKFVIPSGTAVQNARGTSLRTDTTIQGVVSQSNPETGTTVTTVVPTIEEAESMTDLNQAAVDYPFMAGKDNNFMNWHYGTDLSRDCLHMTEGIGRYLVGGALWQMIGYKLSHLNFLGNTYRTTKEDKTNYRIIAVTDRRANIAQKCVIAALDNPYGVSDITE